ncbi:hypothetical protein [Sphingopyxis sp. C-1]|uniref:hypothetical protein n=1 Tax=Sphingopyxis sp. C-1 TaxID=262667 RepID=UPI0006C56798|nr:hypothetical protein [Sphingopyxis sp. C-1]GAO78645.1 hypothetical protein SC1_01954 [Sphingopyxis sp. C-1]
MQQAVDEDGFIWNVDAQGNPVGDRPVGNVNQQQPSRTQVRPGDPAKRYEEPKAAASLVGTQLDNEAKRAALMEAKYGKLPAGMRWKTDMSGAEWIPGVTPPKGTDGGKADAAKVGTLKTVIDQINHIENLFNEHQKGVGLGSVLDYLPTQGNTAFDTAGAGLADLGTAAFKVPGMGPQSDADAARFVAANQPSRWDTDSQVQEKLGVLRRRVENNMKAMGLDAPKWGAQYDPERATTQKAEKEQPDPLTGYVGSDGDYYGPDGPVSGGLPPPRGGGAPGAASRDTAMGGIDAFGRNFANAGTLGLADRLAAGANALLPIDNLFGANNRSVWDGSSFGQAYDANMGLQQQTNAADDQVNPVASFTGDVGGSITGMLGANALLKGLGAGGLVARTGGAAGDVAYGTARGGVEGGAQGALLGGGAALTGNVAGRYLLAPLATKAAGTRVGQAATQATGRTANAIGNAGRGLFGRAPVPYRAGVVPAAVTGGERAAMARIPDDVSQQLTSAQEMGLPMALADTSPQLQTLAGSVVRKSPDAYAMARDTLGARALGQADRAQGQIARNFGPIDNPNEISAALLQKARTDSAPMYEAFRALPARTSPELESMLATPAGREALANARTIAANEGRDPNAMGFDLDQQGQVILRQDPSPETLDFVKRGLDDVVGGYKNPMTGRLDLNGQGASVEGLRKNFVKEVDTLYPGTYAQARAAYAGPASEREALQVGRDMANANPRDIAPRMEGMTPGQREQFKLGQRVAMSDNVDKVRYSTNPYQNIYGSPVAQQRAATVFGDASAAGMKAAYDAEQRMAQTAYDTLGGSPTAMRAAADEAFDTGLPGLVTDAVASYATGSGGQGITQKALTKIVDNARLRGSKKRADQLAPLLFNTDPAAVLAAVQALGKKSAARDVYVKRARKTGGLFGASLGSAGALPFVQ